MALMKNVNGVNMPLTKEEVAQRQVDEDAWLEYQAENGYKEERVSAYPPLSDQLDAIWKVIQSNPDLAIPVDVQAISDQIVQVKEDFPKPE